MRDAFKRVEHRCSRSGEPAHRLKEGIRHGEVSAAYQEREHPEKGEDYPCQSCQQHGLTLSHVARFRAQAHQSESAGRSDADTYKEMQGRPFAIQHSYEAWYGHDSGFGEQ